MSDKGEWRAPVLAVTWVAWTWVALMAVVLVMFVLGDALVLGKASRFDQQPWVVGSAEVGAVRMDVRIE